MLQFTVIGNLGADAQVKEDNGKKFVSFNVAHTDRWTDAEGVVHSSTSWVSCALNGDGGRLLEYLKKGKTVYVTGRGSTRVYSSEKERRMVAGVNISVDRLELIGGSADEVPRELYDSNGAMVRVYKVYCLDPMVREDMKAKGCYPVTLQSVRGMHFALDEHGFIMPIQEPTEG